MRRAEEKKTFVDFSKSEEGKRIYEKNKSLWKNENFLEHIQSLKNPQEIEMAQLMRRYQSSFSWIQKEVDNIKAFQIRHTPTARPEDLGLDIQIPEGYLWLEILVPEKYPEEPASFVLLNHCFSRDFKRWFEKELFDFQIDCKSIMRTIKYMDNNLDQICKKIQGNIAKGIDINPPKPAPVEKVKPVVVEKPAPANGKVQNKETKETKETKEPVTEKSQPTWSQEQQRALEQGIIKYKDIKDAKEKWEKIAADIPGGKTMNECVQRFKECRKAAEEKKNAPEEHKGNSAQGSSNEDEEEGSEEEDEDSDGESGASSDEPTEEQKVNRKIRDYQEYEAALDSVVLAKAVRYENVSVGALVSIQVQVSCKSCNCIHEAEAVKESDSEYLVYNDKCPKCANKCRLVAKQEIFHENSNVICSIGSFTWDIRDLHFCEFDLTCEFCDTANRTKKIIASQPVYMECKGCFKKMQFSYMALTLTALSFDEGGNDEEVAGPNVQDVMKKMFAKKTKFEFKVGFPLPNNGSCKHYKNSNRYFRFACCGKTYPCDDCHDKVEKHEMQLAKSMICGFCSSEQPVGDTCKRCAKTVKKIVRNTGYWEGGQGTRNVNAMSRKDPHKFKGLGKTVSTKKRNQMKTKGK